MIEQVEVIAGQVLECLVAFHFGGWFVTKVQRQFKVGYLLIIQPPVITNSTPGATGCVPFLPESGVATVGCDIAIEWGGNED